MEAVRLFLKDESNERVMARGEECILKGLWKNMSFGAREQSTEQLVETSRLLQLASKSKMSTLNTSNGIQVCSNPSLL